MVGHTPLMALHIQSTLITMLLLLGLLWNKKRTRHITLMSCAIIWDIALIIQIEWNLKAIEKAMQFTKNTFLLNIHVSLAILTVLLYFCMVYTGLRLLKGCSNMRPLHKKLGLTTITLRLLVFATSFFIVNSSRTL